MPETTVQKMIGAITILISLMKPSPSALIHSLVAKLGLQPPDQHTDHDGDQHLNIENLVPGLFDRSGRSRTRRCRSPQTFRFNSLSILTAAVISHMGGLLQAATRNYLCD